MNINKLYGKFGNSIEYRTEAIKFHGYQFAELIARAKLAKQIDEIVQKHLIEMGMESLAQAFERVVNWKVQDAHWRARIRIVYAQCDAARL